MGCFGNLASRRLSAAWSLRVDQQVSKLRKSATLKDVAEAAGVATSTVARVINKKGYVAEDTRKAVVQAVKKTGYRVNSLARSLKSNKSHVIGHLLRSTDPNPFFVKVAQGVETYAQDRGYTTLTYNMQGDAQAEKRGIETFLNWRADALIFSTPVSSHNIKHAIDAGLPLVQVERPRSELGHRITVKNYAGALQAMHHLISLGHRRIAYVGQEPGSPGNPFADYVENERFGAYRDVMAEAGAFDEALVHFAQPRSVEHIPGLGHGYKSMKALLEVPNRITAVMTSSDLIAAGVLQATREASLLIPGDISVIGFDDTLSEYLSPKLTTVALPAEKLGQMAAELLIDDLSGKTSTKTKHIELDAEFILRNSTAPL